MLFMLVNSNVTSKLYDLLDPEVEIRESDQGKCNKSVELPIDDFLLVSRSNT